MFGAQVKLFRLAGFDVNLDLSWVFIALLISWTLATGYFPELYPGLESATYWSMGVVGAAGLFLSIVLHELSHSVVARRYGIPISGITLFIFGGVAQMEREPPTARAEFMMAIAGPLASLGLSLFFYIFAALAVIAAAGTPVSGVLTYLALINLIVAVFNMVPAFPLDGGRVYRAWLWGRMGDMVAATRRAALAGQIFGLILIGLGMASLISGHIVGGLWWGLIGLFLHSASRNAITGLEAQKLLEHESVARVMTADPVTVPADTSLREFVERYVYGSFHETFPVMDGSLLAGSIGVADLRGMGRDEWDRFHVRDLMHPLSALNTIGPAEKTETALRKMREGGYSRLLVVDKGELKGIVALRDIMRLLSLKRDLG
ncbi:MAG: site-2 protease family protein [Alphaproteobacteria bacterium]|nr:site-2 protease family protein [Alphaproteobacteria bacterium]MDX5415327.1 site-2 protease family protein [Alphaproteobacteria bacterium]MDX5492540.1 site-2 protease family protein [Alphaproteobacteria bacterium]